MVLESELELEMNRINLNFLNHEFYGGKVGVGVSPDAARPRAASSEADYKTFFLEAFSIIMQVSMPKIGIVNGFV